MHDSGLYENGNVFYEMSLNETCSALHRTLITFKSRDNIYIHYGFTRFNGNDSMVDMTLNDTECTILSLNHLPGQRMAYKKSGPGRHSSNPTLSAWSEKTNHIVQSFCTSCKAVPIPPGKRGKVSAAISGMLSSDPPLQFAKCAACISM